MSLMTSFDAVEEVYKRLLNPIVKEDVIPFKDTIRGGIYKLNRPINSKAEDAVLNSLGMPGNQVQQGIVNLNLHVPNLQLKTAGNQDSTQYDFKRAQDLTSLAIQEVKEFYSGEYWFLFQQQNIVEQDENELIINIRIEFYSINL